MHPISHCPTASKIWSRFVSLALALLVVTSCQTDPEKPQGRQTYTADLPAIPDTLMPQRGVIKAKSDTATATFTVLPASIKIDLDAPPAETIKVDLWRAGVKMYELDYVHSGSQKLVYTRSKRENSLAVTLIRRIYPASDSVTFAAEFAKLLVDNDPLVLSLGFPAKSIDGLDTALVMRKAMEMVAAKQLPVSSVIPKEGIWALGLDSAGVHERIRALVRSGDIEVDTAKLFPPYPMRTKNGIALEAQLVAGGPAVGITGAFEATYKIVNLSSRVLRDGQENRDFEIPTLVFSEYPKLLELSGKLSIRAKESAAAGNYTLEITAQDDSLRKAVSTVDFQVVPAADKQGPRIEIVAPSANTVLENVVDKIDVKADVSDPSGVDSVWIDNRAASLVDGKWVVQGVFIPVTNLGYKVVVRAKDSKGNISNADIVVGRMAPLDPGAPITSVVQPKETEFPFDSASVMVRWKIEDPRAEVTKVWIGGKEAVKEDGFVWACRVNLPPTGTPTTITFLGINAKNDSTQKFVQLTRKTDAKGPEIEILSPIDGAGVGYEIQSIVVRAKVSDPSGLDSVKINGMKAEEASQEYLRSLNLEPGQSTEIVVEAWDKLSNASRTSIRVSRKGPPDSSAPRITLLEPKDAGVVLPLSSTTTTVKWIVADLFGIADTGVKIAGRQADRSKDTFSLVVAVPAPGKELSYRIDAVNAKGIRNFETVTLKRATDSDAPSVVRVDSGRTVEFEIDSAVASWKVSDNYKMGVVQINGKEIAGSNGLYSVKIGLVFGGNPVILSAKDSIGNSRVDSINVIRTWKDTSKPSIVREAGTDTKNVGFEVGEVSVGWKVTDNGVVTVKINGIKTEPNASGIYGATIVLVDATTGVKIEAVDAAGNSKSDSITITKASDATDPLVVRQSDTKDTTVPYGIATYTVAWKVTDNGGIKTVEIGGKSPSKTGDIYSYQVALSKPGKHVVKIWALDNAGNDFVDSVTIVRAYHDSIAPVVTPADTATRTKTVSYSTAKVVLSWKVTDNDAIYTVAIGGSVVQGSAGIYSRTIDLVVGPNAVLVVAKDTAGNSDSETVVITRATRDSVAPKYARESGTGPVSVSFETQSTTVAWTITDDSKMGVVKINDTVAIQTGSIYKRTVPLVVGSNKVKLVAQDSAGNLSVDSFIVVRVYKDTVKPVITRGTGASDRSAAYSVTETSVAWTVTDNKKIGSVRINGNTIDGVVGVYSASVILDVGRNSVTIVATDSTGNQKVDSITIVRNDYLASKIASYPDYLIGAGDTIKVQIDTLTLLNPTSIKSLEWMPKGGVWSNVSMSNLAAIRLPVSKSEDSGWFLVLRTKNNDGIYTFDTLRVRVMRSYRDPRDGKLYRITPIGSQLWFAQNLSFNSGTNSSCAEQDPTCTKFGRFYAPATSVRFAGRDSLTWDGYCPDGWHIPRQDEVESLISYLKSQRLTDPQALLMGRDEGWEDKSVMDPFGYNLQLSGVYNPHIGWTSAGFEGWGTTGKITTTPSSLYYMYVVDQQIQGASANASTYRNMEFKRNVRCVGNSAPIIDAKSRFITSTSSFDVGVIGTPDASVSALNWAVGARAGVLPIKSGWNTISNVISWDTIGTIELVWNASAAGKSSKDTSLLRFTREFIDSRDNQSYMTTKIGQQTWMATELRHQTAGAGTGLNGVGEQVAVYSISQALNGSLPSSTKIIQGVCPDGWRIPNSQDWTTLLSTVESLWWAKTTSSLKFGGVPHSPEFGNNYTGFSASPTPSGVVGGPGYDHDGIFTAYGLADGKLGVVTDPDYPDPIMDWDASVMMPVRCIKQ